MARPPSPARVALGALAAAALCAASAYVTVPMPGSPVPISLQTLAVLAAGFIAGPAGGLLALGIYLGAGAAGLPVLADGAAGVEVMLGPSAGYLMGFVVAVPLTWLVAEQARGWPRALGVTLGALVGHTAILGLGVAWLVLRLGVSRQIAIDTGALPFVVGGLVKSLALGALVAAGEAIAQRRR